MDYSKGKKIKLPLKNMAVIIDKDIKTTILKMHQELKENVEDIMKMIYKQSEYRVSKEIEDLKRNSGDEKYNK